MSTSAKKISAIAIFYSIAIGLRYYITVIKPDFFTNANLYIQVLLQGIGPLLGGLFVIKLLKRPNDLKLLGMVFLKSLLVISTPILLFAFLGILNNGQLDLDTPKYIGIILVYALFEEYGWRNYLQSELSELNKMLKYLIITVFWFLWHLNFELSMGNLIFFIILFAGSVGIGYVADRTKSLIFVTLFHALFNISQNDLLNGIELKQKLVIVGISAMVIMKYTNRNKKKPPLELEEIRGFLK
ncbi:MAG: CPBP family intramembrane glutamic endopeptidase [Mesonia sp.]|uniref:CPBP family intramembrane glutamic endopeptidase n=1 Tax=Mesonia sp. TaxID=1960830 RepID=UPI003F948EC6